MQEHFAVTYNRDEVLTHWENKNVESMYDKHLLNAEIELIYKRLKQGSKILDAGCGEGEGTLWYCSVPNSDIHAADFSETRLEKARERLSDKANVSFRKVDFGGEYDLDNDFDFIICQRFLINITDWEIQKKILAELMAHLKKGGSLLMLEGCIDGVNRLNEFRNLLGLPDIPVLWHNLFFENSKLVEFMEKQGFKLTGEDGLGPYFLLTRGVRPALQDSLNWDCEFNKHASSDAVKSMLDFGTDFSRLKLWVFQK